MFSQIRDYFRLGRDYIFGRRTPTVLVRDSMFDPNRGYFMDVLDGMKSTVVEVVAVPYSTRQEHRFARREGMSGRQALDFAGKTLEEWSIPNLGLQCFHSPPFRAYHTQRTGLDRVTLLLGTLPNPDTRYDLSIVIEPSAEIGQSAGIKQSA